MEQDMSVRRAIPSFGGPAGFLGRSAARKKYKRD
jgi:hypothetical protein